MASIKAAGSEEPEAYESVRRRGLATENAEGGHFQHLQNRLLKMAFSKAARN